MANGRCYKHGGATPRGIDSPHLKHGRYSRDIPTRLAARYEEAQRDPTLLTLDQDIALIDARLADVLSRVDTGESGALWRQAKAACKAFAKAYRGNDDKKIATTFYLLEDAINGGVSDYDAWGDVRSLINQRARLVEGERKRLVEMEQTMTTQQAMVFLTAVMNAVTKHVPDIQQRTAIAAELTAIATTEKR